MRDVRQVIDRICRETEAEVRREWPARSGHWRRKEAKKRVERRLADLAEAGRGEAILGSLGVLAKITVK